MTIAIGMLCAEGVIIAADQASAFGDGSKALAFKVASGFNLNCSFAIAHSTDDGDAALTLQGNIVEALTESCSGKVSDAKEIIIEQMTSWALPWASPPSIQFLIGFCGREDIAATLLYASPPNTMRVRTFSDNSLGYHAIGTGASVTDPLHLAFLNGRSSAQNSLSKIAYLMDKAKKGNIYCGGGTNAILVRRTLGPPDWITPVDLESAERLAGSLDFYLNWTEKCFFGQTDEGVGQLAEGLANAVKAGRSLRNIRFRTLLGEEIIDTSVQAPV